MPNKAHFPRADKKAVEQAGAVVGAMAARYQETFTQTALRDADYIRLPNRQKGIYRRGWLRGFWEAQMEIKGTPILSYAELEQVEALVAELTMVLSKHNHQVFGKSLELEHG